MPVGPFFLMEPKITYSTRRTGIRLTKTFSAPVFEATCNQYERVLADKDHDLASRNAARPGARNHQTHRTKATHLVAALILIGAASIFNRTAVAQPAKTATPIQHLIVIIGENRGFDHVFGLYKPTAGQTIWNLLSRGIVTQAGKPGPNFSSASQYKTSGHARFFISPGQKSLFQTLPPPDLGGAHNTTSDIDPPPFATLASVRSLNFPLPAEDLYLLTTGATGLGALLGPDTRVANALNLPNGPFQLTGPTFPYDSYSGNSVHRFYQMWQQSDCDVRQASPTNPSGCLSDLYPFVATTFADVNVGGGTAMAFFNMASGDAPYLKQLADEFTISDNYHQAQMGGSHAQMIYLGMADAIFYADAKGEPAIPRPRLIANPEPLGGTNNRYTQDSVYSACFDRSQPGVASIRNYLASLPYAPDPKCEKGHYYLLNNAAPGFELDGTRSTNPRAIPPSAARTIADALAEKGISFRYYAGGLRSAISGIPGGYCAICNPFQHVSSIMKNDSRRSEVLKDVHDLINDIAHDTLPAVSYVKPDGYLDGHPANSKLNLFEAFVRNIVERIRAKPAMFASTATLVTFDEGGGYYDSGFIQPIDFFGDGPRIPLIVVSPYSTGGRIVHNYSDHVSVIKFIERNWHLAPLTSRSRDNLPNPIANISSPYIPANMPAIGDLFDAFQFNLRQR